MTTIAVEIEPMILDDYEEVAALWAASAGVGLDEHTDTRAGVSNFLVRNPGFSLVARRDDRIVGAVLCGHDGRRGCLYHLAVASRCREQGIGRALVEACLARLGDVGIRKCNIFLYADNAAGAAFWNRLGWKERVDLKILQKPTPNA